MIGQYAAPTFTLRGKGRNGIQALRIAAVLMLVAYHAALVSTTGAPGGLGRAIAMIAGSGWIGTDLFLAIAGFLAFQSSRRSRGTGAWLSRRFLRIIPSYWAFIAFYLFLLPWLLSWLGFDLGRLTNYGSLDQARASLACLLTMTTNIVFGAGTWIGAALEPLLTIAIGMQLTLLVALLRSPRLEKMTPALIAALEALGFALRWAFRDASPWLSYSLPFTRCDAFLLAYLAAWAMNGEARRARVEKSAFSVLAASAAGCIAVFVVNHGLVLDRWSTIQLGFPLIGLFFASLVLCVARLEEESSRGTTERTISTIGAFAYGAYLFKLPAIDVINDLTRAGGLRLGTVGLFLIGAVAALVLGGIWYSMVESPLSRIVSRLVPKD
jgi:peptidoglycan/LPS O-acetylase OafA/YrhL